MTKYTEEGQAIHHSTPFKNDFIYFIPLFTTKNKNLSNKTLCDICNTAATKNDLIIIHGQEKHIHEECKKTEK